MISNQGYEPNRSMSPGIEAKQLAEQSYRQQIVARQCLNKLVDIKSAIARQNKLLEILIDQLNAAQYRNASK